MRHLSQVGCLNRATLYCSSAAIPNGSCVGRAARIPSRVSDTIGSTEGARTRVCVGVDHPTPGPAPIRTGASDSVADFGQ